MKYSFDKNRLKELREERGVSQRQLAIVVNTSQANISRWEKGLVEPSVLVCWRLADYFGVSIDFLCGRSDY